MSRAAWLDAAAAAAILIAAAIVAVAWVSSHGYTLYYGDAEAHLNIARRIADSRTPGPEQIGTVWLPLPHLAMLPFVTLPGWWESGRAGAVVSAGAFVLAGLLLFAAAREAFGAAAPAYAAFLLFALNPNVLYLSAIPMTEALMFAAVAGLLFSSICFAKDRSWWAVLLAALFSNAASLTRYEGWSIIPVVAIYFFVAGGERRWSAPIVFGVLASIAPLAWLAHNHWYYSNALEFYNGPYSAKAIYQRALDAGMQRYPGDGEMIRAAIYYSAAVRHCCGWGLLIVSAVGAVAAAAKRVWWPLVLLGVPPAFYILSLYSSGTPVFVPDLWPNSYYNTRYGLAAMPLLAFAGAALVAVAPVRLRVATALALACVAAAPSVWTRQVITWKESQVNSETRRAWTSEAASFFRENYRPGDGVIASFGDLAGIFRAAGMPLREVLHDGNHPAWEAALARPDLFLHERWAVAISGDPVATALLRTVRGGTPYRRVRIITYKNGPVIEIYERSRPAPSLSVPSAAGPDPMN